MKSNNLGCKRFMLFGITGLAILCLAAAGLAAWDNTRLPERSKVTDKLSEVEKAHIIEAQHLRRATGDEILPGWGKAAIPVILYNEDYACPDRRQHATSRRLEDGSRKPAAW